MKTNDIFNLRRFGKYFSSDLKNCLANYWLSMLLISLMGLIIYSGTVIMGLVFTGEWGGPEQSFRVFTFVVSMFVLMTTMPVKCYGMITDKKAGTQWLMVPVSAFEKTLSMVITTIMIAPLLCGGIYLVTDLLLCSLDSTCGTAILSSISELMKNFVNIAFASEGDIHNFPAIADLVRQVINPWLYVDDIVGIALIFLLGAILFKTGKTAKTILAYLAVSMALGMVLTPVTGIYFKEIVTNINLSDSPEALNELFSMGIFRHAALFDTLNDTLVNIALLACIYFRIKTLKH